MPPEDQNTGTDQSPPPESDVVDTSIDTTPAPETPAPETTEVHDTTPINPIADVLAQFDAERDGTPAPPKTTSTTQAPPPKQSRDYSGLDESELPVFKHLPNRIYQDFYPRYIAAKKQIQEAAELKSQLDEQRNSHFFEQDGAWTLAPEYQELSQGQNQLSRETEFWQQQLENIEAGNEWSELFIDQQTNRVVAGPPQPASPQGKAKAMSKLTQAHTMLNSIGQQISQFESGFKAKHQGFTTKLKEIEGQIFGGPQNVAKLEVHAKKKMELFPRHLQGRQEIQTLAKALVLIDGLIAQVRQLKGSAVTQTIKTNTARTAGPAGGTSGAGGLKNQNGTVGSIVDQFNRAKMGV